MTYKKVWSYQELAEKMKGRIFLPKRLHVYSFSSYPHWALVTALHYQRPISEEDLENNLEVISLIPENEIHKMDIHDLIDRGITA